MTRELTPGALSRLEWIAGGEPAPITVGRYRVLREIGHGAMGAVYEAEDTQLGRRVALKVLRALGAEFRARFEREARAMASVAHPNVVTVYDAGEADGHPYIAMELVPGKPLAPSPDGVALLAAAARGVEAAHAAGIVHRDLKPANILVAGTTVKVADFGIARAMDETGLTRTGASMGTPSYMAPEQAAGRTAEIGPATDVYALGVILYEMLTGLCPHSGATAAEVVHRILSEDPIPPRRRNGKTPAALDAVCLMALEKRASKRYATAAAFADDLDRFLRGEPVVARAPGAATVMARKLRRRPTIVAVAIVLALSAGVGTWVVIGERAERARQRSAALASFLESTRRAREVMARVRERLERATATRVGLASQIESSAPAAEKQPLWDVERQIEDLEREAREARGDLVVACSAALAIDGSCAEARSAMAELYGGDFRAAEAARDPEAMKAAAKLARYYDAEAPAEKYALEGSVELTTDPPAALAWLFRYEEGPDRRLVARPFQPSSGTSKIEAGCTEFNALGRTPVTVRVPIGSYLLILRKDLCRETRRPVLVGRGTQAAAVRLFADERIGAGFVHVPAGPFLAGRAERAAELPDYFISRQETTCREYQRFLNDRSHHTADQAWAHVPRRAQGPMWTRKGDRIEAAQIVIDWPVIWISPEDAGAYAEWLSKQDKSATCRLPTGLEWEKAARGVDGRAYPWGERFDWAFTIGGGSRARDEERGPARGGSMEADESVYGVIDMAGNVREICGEPMGDGRVVRGGDWVTNVPDYFRASHGARVSRAVTGGQTGFRVVKVPK